MTYCLAMRLDEGLVFLADTRTNAGVDNIGSYRKLHAFYPGPDRVFVLESAGNLATTQEVLDRIQRDLVAPPDHVTLATAEHLFEAALYVGTVSVNVAAAHRPALGAVDGTSTFILGGQIAGQPPDIFLVYPEGNYIRASEERPFLQIGESKYGKFMLELAVQAEVGLDQAAKIALSSMISTAHANLSVGPPYDLAVLRPDRFALDEVRIPAESPMLERLTQLWRRHLLDGVALLPDIQPGEADVVTDPVAGT